MSDEATFREALRASPADRTARLVFADWLDEQDHPEDASYMRRLADFAEVVPIGGEFFPKTGWSAVEKYHRIAGLLERHGVRSLSLTIVLPELPLDAVSLLGRRFGPVVGRDRARGVEWECCAILTSVESHVVAGWIVCAEADGPVTMVASRG